VDRGRVYAVVGVSGVQNIEVSTLDLPAKGGGIYALGERFDCSRADRQAGKELNTVIAI